MGRKKYFCDFCCRFFNDDRNTRMKHLNSVAHMKAKAEHYDMFKDPEIILRENESKKPCRRFQSDGYCQYGSCCTYSHYSPYQLNQIRAYVARSKSAKNNIWIPPSESFYEKYSEIKYKRSPVSMMSIWSHELPINLGSVSDNVPPSMKPFNVSSYEKFDLEEWGYYE